MTRQGRWLYGVPLLALALSLTACGSTSPAPLTPGAPEQIDAATQLVAHARAVGPGPGNSTAMSAVARADAALGLAMLRRLGSDSSNVTVSPLSLYPVLAMLQDGARGRTATQIATALQSGGLSTAEQNAGWAALSSSLAKAAQANGITLHSADSLWVQQGVDVRRPFLTDLAHYYDAGVWQSDLVGNGPSAINQWVDEHTQGKIDKLFDHLDAGTELVVADALYLEAAWQHPFDPNRTDVGTFTRADGSRVTAKLMTGPTEPTWTTAAYRAAELPYRGGRFAALAIMPTGNLSDFVAGLTPSTIAAMTKPAAATSLPVLLPRFTTQSTLPLIDTLRGLGMRDAFGPSADLSAINDDGLQVSQAVQKTYLQVGEQGTTAAAASGVELAATGAQFEVAFDHPFVFLIRDTVTGAILFASEINDPTG